MHPNSTLITTGRFGTSHHDPLVSLARVARCVPRRAERQRDLPGGKRGLGRRLRGRFRLRDPRPPVEETTIGELPDDLTGALRENLESLPDERIEGLAADASPALASIRSSSAGDPHDRLAEALLSTPITDAPAVTWSDLLREAPDNLENLLDQLERYVEDGVVYAYIDLHDGECRETAVLEDPESRDPGFTIAGPYPEWVDLIEGADVMEAILSQDMDLDGSVTTIMRYGDAGQELGIPPGRSIRDSCFKIPARVRKSRDTGEHTTTNVCQSRSNHSSPVGGWTPATGGISSSRNGSN